MYLYVYCRSCNSCEFHPEPADSYEAVRQGTIYERTVMYVNTTTNTLTFAEPLVQSIRSKFGGAW